MQHSHPEDQEIQTLKSFFADLQSQIKRLGRLSNRSYRSEAEEITLEANELISTLSKYCEKQFGFLKEESKKVQFLKQKLAESEKEKKSRGKIIQVYKENLEKARNEIEAIIEEKDAQIHKLLMQNRNGHEMQEYSIVSASGAEQSLCSLPDNSDLIVNYEQSVIEEEDPQLANWVKAPQKSDDKKQDLEFEKRETGDSSVEEINKQIESIQI